MGKYNNKNNKQYESSKYTKNIRPLNDKQAEYMAAIEDNLVTIGVGAAGTGKTFLAVYKACKMFDNNDIDKIILVRPAVEAGEKLGYLPGNLEEKLDPYLRPLFDALESRWGPKKVFHMMETGEIEIAALGFMRGRTLNNCFVILDEAQNTSIEQMKMFLTRFGDNVRVVINGDPMSSDLHPVNNGLIYSSEYLEECKFVGLTKFENKDVVRSDLVKEILKYIGSQ